MDAWDRVSDLVLNLGTNTFRIAAAFGAGVLVFCLIWIWAARRRARAHSHTVDDRTFQAAEQVLDARRWQPDITFPGARAIEQQLLGEVLLWLEGRGRAGERAREALVQGDIAPALTLASEGRRLRRGGAKGRQLIRHALVLRALREPARALVKLANEAKLLASDPLAKAWTGVLAASVGERALARQVLEEVLRASAEHGDKRIAATAILGLATLSEHTGEHGRAIALYVQAARLKRTEGELADAARASEAAGRLLAARQDWRHALDVLASGFTDARRTGDATLVGALALAMAPVAAAAREQGAVSAETLPEATGTPRLNAA